jgi:hypothetical protein
MRAELESALTDKDKDALRARRIERLTLVPAEASTPTQSPFEQSMTAWRAIEDRVQSLFRRNGIPPSSETLRATTWLAFQLDEGWSFWNIRKTDARQFLQEIVRGSCVATFNDRGHVVIRNAPRASARIVL